MTTTSTHLRLIQLLELVKDLALCRHAAEQAVVSRRVVALHGEMQAEVAAELAALEAQETAAELAALEAQETSSQEPAASS